MMDGNENLLDNDLTRNYDLQNPSTQNQQPLLWQMWPQEECQTNGAEFVPTMFGPLGGAGAFDHPYNLSNEHGAGMDN